MTNREAARIDKILGAVLLALAVLFLLVAQRAGAAPDGGAPDGGTAVGVDTRTTSTETQRLSVRSAGREMAWVDEKGALHLPPNSDVGSDGVVHLSGDDDPSLGEVAHLVRLIVRAAKHKQWRYLVALVLVGLTFVARRFGAKKIPWLATDRGAVALHLGVALGSAMGSLLLSKTSLTADALADAGLNALAAAGGYAMLKKLLAPKRADDKKTVVAAGAA